MVAGLKQPSLLVKRDLVLGHQRQQTIHDEHLLKLDQLIAPFVELSRKDSRFLSNGSDADDLLRFRRNVPNLLSFSLGYSLDRKKLFQELLYYAAAEMVRYDSPLFRAREIPLMRTLITAPPG